MCQRVDRHCTIQVVHVPIFYALAPCRELLFYKRPVLGLLHRNDMVGRGEVGFGQRHREAFALVRTDSTFLETGDGVLGDRAEITGVDRQTARCSLTWQIALARMPIEKNFRVAASIIVARAEEKNEFWLVAFRVGLWFHRDAETCVQRVLRFIVSEVTEAV